MHRLQIIEQLPRFHITLRERAQVHNRIALLNLLVWGVFTANIQAMQLACSQMKFLFCRSKQCRSFKTV